MKHLTLAILLAACGGSPAASPATNALSSTPPDLAPTPPSPGPTAAPAEAAPDPVATFRTLIQACNDWNMKVGNTPAGQLAFDGGPSDPTRTITEVGRPSPGKVLLQDADGARLVLDLASRTVHAEAGESSPLPIRYSFCPAETFRGPHLD